MLPKRLVFCGGGTRCLVFLQALVELEKRGNLTKVHEYWGTSAGAMIATLFALSKSSTTVKQLMFSANYKNFRDVDISNIFGIQTSWGIDDGKLLVSEIEKLVDTIQPGNKSKCLRDISGLNIVISDLTLRKTIVCNSNTFPDLRVVDAIRASMSLPIFFKPYIHTNGHIWVDGAIRANFPWHVLPDDKARSESLGFTFDKSIHKQPPKTFMEYLYSMIRFDEPNTIQILKKKWVQNILWFRQPPYPSWFVRLQSDDFKMVEQIGTDAVQDWLKHQAPYSKSLKSHPLSVHRCIHQSSCRQDHTNELLDSHEPCHEPDRGFSQPQCAYKPPSFRRWSV